MHERGGLEPVPRAGSGPRDDHPPGRLRCPFVSGPDAATPVLMEQFDVRADAQRDDDNVMLTVSGESWLLNVHASPSQWDQGFSQIAAAGTGDRREVSLGTSAGTTVWWGLTDDELVLTVGPNTESWDFIATVPRALLAAIQAEVAGVEED